MKNKIRKNRHERKLELDRQEDILYNQVKQHVDSNFNKDRKGHRTVDATVPSYMRGNRYLSGSLSERAEDIH